MAGSSPADRNSNAQQQSPKTAPMQEVKSYLQAVRNRRLGPRQPADIPHAIVIPRATYSPWLTEPAFREDYGLVYKNTLVDIYRCYELWSLTGQTLRTPGDILEVGVWRGGTGVLMALQARRVNSKAKVYLCDTFSGVAMAGDRDSHYKGGEHSDTSADIVENLVAKTNLENVEILVGMFPADSGSILQQNNFSFCHIDVDVYESAKATFEWVWPRLNRGGIVVFDDYGFLRCGGVTKLVNELSAPGRTFVHNLNGHAIIMKA